MKIFIMAACAGIAVLPWAAPRAYAADDFYMEIYYTPQRQQEKLLTLDSTGQVKVAYYNSNETDAFLLTPDELTRVRGSVETEVKLSNSPVAADEAVRSGGLRVRDRGLQGFENSDFRGTWTVLYGIIAKKLVEANTASKLVYRELAPDKDYSNISDPRERWKAYGFKNYSIGQRYLTGGGPAISGRLYIVNGKKSAVEGDSILRSLAPIPDMKQAAGYSADIKYYKSVEELFAEADRLERSEEPGLKHSVEYDPRYGYPSEINSWTLNKMNSESVCVTSDFKIIEYK